MSLPIPNPLSSIKNYAIAGVAVVVLGTIVYLGWTKADLEADMAKIQADNAALTFANKEFADKISAMNAAELTREREIAIAEKAAEKESEKDNNSAAALGKMKVDKDSCKAAKELTDAFFRSKK